MNVYSESTMVIFDGGLYGLMPDDRPELFYQILRPRPSLLAKALCKVCLSIGLGRSYWYGNWKYRIKKTSRVVIFSAWYDRFIFRYIKSRNPSCQVRIYCWNKIEPKDKIGRLIRAGAAVWSFDPADCVEYGLKFNPQFYVQKRWPEGNEVLEQEAIFVGQAKNRLAPILQAKSELEAAGVTSLFLIVRTKGVPYTAEESRYLVERTIPYEEMLKRIFSSNAIVDICVPGQEGLTLRVLEALYYSKKLITNNASVANYKLYSPDRVFILGRDDPAMLKAFLKSPVAPASKALLDEYSFDTWLGRFFSC